MPSLTATLHQLTTAGLIYQGIDGPELEYLFRHALIQEAAYESLLRQERKRLHQQVAETLVARYRAGQHDLAGSLGLHYLAADDPQARPYLHQAGDQALDRYANAEAVRYYEAALPFAALAADRAALLRGLGEALFRLGQGPAAVAVWRQAIAAAAQVPDYDLLGRLYGRAARAASYAGNVPGSCALAEEGLAALAGTPPTVGQAALLHEAARSSYFAGQVERARTLSRQALDLAAALDATEVRVDALVTAAMLDPDDSAALAQLEEAIRLAETASLFQVAVRAHQNWAATAERAGRHLGLAVAHYDQAILHARRRGAVAEEIFSRAWAANIRLSLGEFAVVPGVLDDLRRQIAGLGNPPLLGVWALRLAEARLLYYQGRPEALAVLRAFQEEVRQQDDPEMLAEVNTALAEPLIDSGDLAAAVVTLEEALRLHDWDTSSLTVRCLLCVVYARQGNLAGAEAEFQAVQAAAGPRPSPREQAYLSRAAAYLATASGRFAEAADRLAEAAAAEAQVGRRWYQARILQDWAALVARTAPESARAAALRAEAARLFAAMGLPVPDA
jgi:tetratricopeptide (TPR) repeat protein